MLIKLIGAAPTSDNGADMLTSSDFTYLGAFLVPSPPGFDPADTNSGLTVRNVSGTDYLYFPDRSGMIEEFTAPSLLTSPPFNTGTETQIFDDIYGTNLFMHTNCNGFPGPDQVGLASGLRPWNISWIGECVKDFTGRRRVSTNLRRSITTRALGVARLTARMEPA